jgi:hypothetical protein
MQFQIDGFNFLLLSVDDENIQFSASVRFSDTQISNQLNLLVRLQPFA